MAKSKQLAKVVEEDDNDVIPFDGPASSLPVPTKGSTGMESMDHEDYKTPRIVLLQGLSPELEAFPNIARKGNFWHTGMNMSLGIAFLFVPVIVNKRVILFRPRGDQGGGILAFSKDGKTWDSGANTEFSVKMKGVKFPVKWNTRKDVASSGLLQFGSSNPDLDRSAPAATRIYEYLCYLPRHPELSPCVMSVSKTGLPNGRSLNTSLAMKARAGYPTYTVAVNAFVENMHNEEGEWTVAKFNPAGHASERIVAITKKIAESYGEIKVDYKNDNGGGDTKIDDEIQY